MAETRFLTSNVEDHVRGWLGAKFHTTFRKLPLPLSGVRGEPKKHEFDAVSGDGEIVCGIRTSSWKTSGGKRGSGKVAEAYQEIYFLNLVRANQRFLVLTDPEFFERFGRESTGKLVSGVELLHCPLPGELLARVEAIRVKAQDEVGGGKSNEKRSRS